MRASALDTENFACLNTIKAYFLAFNEDMYFPIMEDFLFTHLRALLCSVSRNVFPQVLGWGELNATQCLVLTK